MLNLEMRDCVHVPSLMWTKPLHNLPREYHLKTVNILQEKPCIFCSIIKGEIEANVVFRDNVSIAFLDKKPLFLGHCLLVPIDHYETFVDLPESLIGPVFRNARLLTAAVQKALNADGSFVAINNKVSQSVPHLHVHIIPRKQGDGLRGFFWPRQKYESLDAMEDIQKRLMIAIEETQSKLS